MGDPGCLCRTGVILKLAGAERLFLPVLLVLVLVLLDSICAAVPLRKCAVVASRREHVLFESRSIFICFVAFYLSRCG